MKNSNICLDGCIDTKYSPETSIVLRYRNAFEFGTTDREDSEYKECLQMTSIREGARIFHLLTYKGVEIYILDETSLMHTGTLKSIDGCVTIAKCKSRGYDRVVFESGGNTGTALTEYGQRVGIETFLFLPEDNVSLLNNKTFESHKAHLITVKEPGLTKEAAHIFERRNGLHHIPQVDWRYEASRFRGFFLLEYILNNEHFDWLSQTISAAFGPIGIYSILTNFSREIGKLPRFLGIQQKVNSPMVRAWKSKKPLIEPVEFNSTKQLLSRVMYDVKSHTYGTYQDLTEILVSNRGDLTTIDKSEFADFLEYDFEGKCILDLFQDNGLNITVSDGEIVEKSGLISLAGTLKEVEAGQIKAGSKVLCCMTGGTSNANGQAEPEYRITGSDGLDSMITAYSKTVFGQK